MNSMTILFNKKHNTFILTHAQYELLPKEFKDKCVNFTFYSEKDFNDLIDYVKIGTTEDLKIIEVDSLLKEMSNDNNETHDDKPSNGKLKCLVWFVLGMIMVVSGWVYNYIKYGLFASLATAIVFIGCMIIFITLCVGTYLLYLDTEVKN
jgi:hypothetical protein